MFSDRTLTAEDVRPDWVKEHLASKPFNEVIRLHGGRIWVHLPQERALWHDLIAYRFPHEEIPEAEADAERFYQLAIAHQNNILIRCIRNMRGTTFLMPLGSMMTPAMTYHHLQMMLRQALSKWSSWDLANTEQLDAPQAEEIAEEYSQAVIDTLAERILQGHGVLEVDPGESVDKQFGITPGPPSPTAKKRLAAADKVYQDRAPEGSRPALITFLGQE